MIDTDEEPGEAGLLCNYMACTFHVQDDLDKEHYWLNRSIEYFKRAYDYWGLAYSWNDLGQLWGWGTVAAAQPDTLRARQRDWAVWNARMDSGVRDLQRYLARAIDANPTLRTRLPLGELQAAQAFHTTTDALGADAGTVRAVAAANTAHHVQVILKRVGIAGLEGCLAELAAAHAAAFIAGSAEITILVWSMGGELLATAGAPAVGPTAQEAA